MTSNSIKAKKKIQIPRKMADYCMKSLKKIIPSDPAYSYQQGPVTPNLDLARASLKSFPRIQISPNPKVTREFRDFEKKF